jgi:hypothetical protein
MTVVSPVVAYVNTAYVFYISAVLGNGDGTFQSPVLTTVQSTDPLLVADLNGDGKDDLIQVHGYGNPSSFDVWLSDEDGTFKQGANYEISPASLSGGMLTDVNGDGKIDLVAVDSQIPGLVRTLLGNGDGTFQSPTSVTLASQAPSDLVFADFNGDGKPDFADYGPNDQVVVYLQEGGNFVLTGNPLTSSDSVYSYCGLASGDLNGDGVAEIVTLNCGSTPDDNKVSVFVNNGAGTFATGVYYNNANSGGNIPANTGASAAVIADINGDGRNDMC